VLIPDSVELLNELDWKAFESLATLTLQRYYAPQRVSIVQTRLSHDGGRDGEGIYTLGEDVLALVYRIWIEVKKRSHADVGLDDIGKNLVLASNEDGVFKLIVVTNRSFAPQVVREVHRFAARNRMSYALLDGTALLAIAQRVWREDIPPSPEVSAGRSLSIDILFGRQPYSPETRHPGTIVVPQGEPVFVTATIRRDDLGPPERFTITLAAEHPALRVVPYGATTHLLGPGDTACSVFALLDAATDLTVHALRVEVRSSEKASVSVAIASESACKITRSLLSSWLPDDRRSLIEQWADRVRQWAQGDQAQALSLAIVAYAGVGKSLVLGRLRTTWLSQGVSEVYIDGGLHSTDVEIAAGLFELAFPWNPELLGNDAQATVADWLGKCGIDDDRSRSIAAAICRRRPFQSSLCNSKELADLCVCLLAQFSSRRPVVLVVDDLHFCQPSAIELLANIHRVVERSGITRLAVVSTSRPLAASADSSLQIEWWTQVAKLFATTAAERVPLEALRLADAIVLLQATVPTLQAHHARLIVERVGCTPLALREAIAYFATTGVIRQHAVLGEWVADPDRLLAEVASDELKRATSSRLVALKARFPAWLADFLDAAACVGRYFPLRDVLPDSWPDDAESGRALDLCEQLDVIKPFAEGLYVFDHDFIRTTLLGSISNGRQQRVASWLCQRPCFKEDQRHYPSLLYQAGRFREAASAFRAAGTSAMRINRFSDAIQDLWLSLASFDPATRSAVAPQLAIDAALVHAAAPQPQPPSEEDRRQILETILALLECLGATSVYASPLAAALISEATMLATRLGSRQVQADLLLMEGIRHFERDELEQSHAAHQRAEALYASLPTASGRAMNLLRLAITLRQENRLEESLATIRQAHRMQVPTDRALLVRLMLNTGAAYLGTDLRRVHRYWRAALRTATADALVELRVHSLLDVGYVSFLLADDEAAAGLLGQALALAQQAGLENSVLRGRLDFACLCLARGDLLQAHELLVKAEEIGLREGIGRRLWRVRANLATTLEALGDIRKAFVIDEQLLGQERFAARAWGSSKRSLLPLLNVALRAAVHEDYRRLLAGLPAPIAVESERYGGLVLSGAAAALPLLVRSHLRSVAGVPRFLVTE
jgi:tetratricopeptide (TPR) repeat protein